MNKRKKEERKCKINNSKKNNNNEKRKKSLKKRRVKVYIKKTDCVTYQALKESSLGQEDNTA